MSVIYTTGTTNVVVKGAKGRIDGTALPEGDDKNILPKQFVGAPLDLNAGTGTLVGNAGATNIKGGSSGTIDYITGIYWVMKITK